VVVEVVVRSALSTHVKVDAFTKLRKANFSFVMSVCLLSVRPSAAKIRLQLEGFSWNSVYGDLLKTCRENSIFIKICQY